MNRIRLARRPFHNIVGPRHRCSHNGAAPEEDERIKTKRLPFTAVLVLLTLLATLLSSAFGQDDVERNRRKIPRYKLVDLGTLGGPASYVNPAMALGAPNQMNGRGATVGAAATSVPTFLGCPFCNGIDGHVYDVFHAFKWCDGALEDLGAIPGELTNSVATSINAEGSVVGHSENGRFDPLTGTREFRAALWKGGRMTDLGTFGGNHSIAGKINDRGQIAGSALNAIPDPFSWLGLFLGSSNSTQTRAFLWENGHKRDLGTLGGPDAAAGRVNERGEVVGVSYTNAVANPTTGIPTLGAFLWRNGKMIDLGNFGGTLAGCCELNNRSQVIGVLSLPGDQFFDPFLWDDGHLLDLFTSSAGGNPFTANALNDAGQIVGAAGFFDHPYDAYVWKNGVATDIGFLDGDCYSEAFVTNSKGLVAGQSFSCPMAASARPFLWQEGTMFDLNELIQAPPGFRFTLAFVINDRGEIGGIGTPDGCDVYEVCGHAVVLLPCRDRHCEDESAIAAVKRIPTPARQNSGNVLGKRLPSREIAARIQAKYGANRRFLVPNRK